MKSESRYWLLLEKSDDTRVSQGIDSYNDETGKEYNYDSLVSNHKNLKKGNQVIIRKENKILGAGVVKEIATSSKTKTHRRCPECGLTDIRERKTKKPKWKCGSKNCGAEFAKEKTTKTRVTAYRASIESFLYLKDPPTVESVKSCALRGDGTKSQLSMLELDVFKCRNLLEKIELQGSRSPTNKLFGQGYGLSYEERKAVETQAMKEASELYEKDGWTVEDRSLSSPYDLFATKGTKKRYIEVKGTTGDGSSIILTHGEVRHVMSHKTMSALVVVSKIKLKKQGGDWIGFEGVITSHDDPWTISESSLKPTQFRYEIP